jgi:hypothetical protein
MAFEAVKSDDGEKGELSKEEKESGKENTEGSEKLKT